RLRRWLGPVWTLWQQKYYFDHLWALLLTGTLYTLSRVASWLDDHGVDSLVRRIGLGTYQAGTELRAEQSGRIQEYLLLLVVAAVVLIMGLGAVEPQFVLSPFQFLQGGPR
ncbi:MAG: hypothetical protein AB1758_30810, partial [Candidatus Eremiobacterota bacterium]